MPVPAFKDYLLPTLKSYSDGQTRKLSETVTPLADHFHLSDADRSEMLESGAQTRHVNRVAWAHVYLAKAKLLERVARAKYSLTGRGREVLGMSLAEITPSFLRQRFPEFATFATAHTNSQPGSGSDTSEPEATKTPEEVLDGSYQTLRAELAAQLLDVVKQSSPAFFERLVIDLLVAMGYGGSRIDAGRAVGQSGDGGIDGIIKEDRLGLDAVYVQAKRWEGNVGRPVVQAFVGALAGRKANKGVLITTSGFSTDAKLYAETIPQKLVLIDGEQLTQYMIDFGVGVATASTYVVKKLDSDYFDAD
jgi:restriction system protein